MGETSNAEISPIPAVDGFRRLAFDAVGSTNVEALKLACDGDPGNLWVTATEQLSGKARRGRSWVSKPGNLYASLLLIDCAPPEKLATLPLVVSVALHDAIEAAAPSLKGALSIKWPNDLLVDGKKVSGILLEASVLPDGRRAVVIGCGINCAHFPDNPLYPATSLAAEGATVAPNELFKAFTGAMARSLSIWDRGKGFTHIRSAWLSAAKGLGDTISARFETHTLTGRFEALDADGLLVLIEQDGTEHRISAADIFFGESRT